MPTKVERKTIDIELTSSELVEATWQWLRSFKTYPSTYLMQDDARYVLGLRIVQDDLRNAIHSYLLAEGLIDSLTGNGRYDFSKVEDGCSVSFEIEVKPV